MFRPNRFVLLFLVLCFVTVPYLYAAGLWRPDLIFGGFIANPIDGASYLAKMQEGWAGGWKFTLLYSAQPTPGAHLFLFYIFLGHLAKLLNTSLVVMFHTARILAAVGLLVALSKTCDRLFSGDPDLADKALWLAALGSGLGWLVLLVSGDLGADFWVAEGYPFLSMVVNPHFPLGLALILCMFVLDQGEKKRYRWLLLSVFGLLVSIIQPFGLVLAGVLLFLTFLYRWLAEKQFAPWGLVFGLCLGGPFLIYQFWAIHTDPLLAAWDAQNLTPAPGPLDFILSLSPALFLAIAGIYAVWSKNRTSKWAVMTGWLVATTTLVYIPFSLQRRFMTGIYIPTSFLAVTAVAWFGRNRFWRRYFYIALLSFSLLTNLFLILLMFIGPSKTANPDGSASTEGKVYIPRATMDALVWLRDHTPSGSVVLANADTGLFVPAWSGRRTVYGHPFETPNAAQEKQAVEQYYSGMMSDLERSEFIDSRGVDFILWEEDSLPIEGEIVYDQSGVRISEISP